MSNKNWEEIKKSNNQLAKGNFSDDFSDTDMFSMSNMSNMVSMSSMPTIGNINRDDILQENKDENVFYNKK